MVAIKGKQPRKQSDQKEVLQGGYTPLGKFWVFWVYLNAAYII